jgi:hypothetical protein
MASPEAIRFFKGMKATSKTFEADLEAQEFTIEDFTCAECLSVATCRSAFDFYNTCGNCLMEKQRWEKLD